MTTHNNTLAIAIPTYNRAEILNANLRSILPELRQYAIPVYISDDSPNFDTEAIIKQLQSEYSHIYYRHNQPSFGHDNNFFTTITMPECEFVWYMGDSLYIQPGVIGEILNILTEGMDFCFVNYQLKDQTNLKILDAHAFLLEKTWYLTLSGATIYGRKPRALIIDAEIRENWHNFPQLGLVLAYCSQNSVSAYWYGNPAIGLNKNKQNSYWSADPFSVFVADWSGIIRSFPTLFSRSEMDSIIKSHALNTPLFRFRHLIALRAKQELNPAIFKKHQRDLRVASPINPLFAYIVSYLPVNIAKFLWNLMIILKHILKHNA
jgi:glycosyltransferase involved in cell wall biosynthesis